MRALTRALAPSHVRTDDFSILKVGSWGGVVGVKKIGKIPLRNDFQPIWELHSPSPKGLGLRIKCFRRLRLSSLKGSV